eukprot:TRINITY_DN44180_c0_g1_i1.p2 TRINITY_DN44180_c0_g1~~TRINITY_DN44180_c0_g1_i1.p2  ORF type:complete len:206 (-),score=23.04 TRINITY_DN44180_c0_g1_i1:302-919(-)
MADVIDLDEEDDIQCLDDEAEDTSPIIKVTKRKPFNPTTRPETATYLYWAVRKSGKEEWLIEEKIPPTLLKKAKPAAKPIKPEPAVKTEPVVKTEAAVKTESKVATTHKPQPRRKPPNNTPVQQIKKPKKEDRLLNASDWSPAALFKIRDTDRTWIQFIAKSSPDVGFVVPLDVALEHVPNAVIDLLTKQQKTHGLHGADTKGRG